MRRFSAQWPGDMNYPDQVLRHFDRPVAAGHTPSGTGQRITGEAGGIDTGTQVCFEFQVEDQRITDLGYRVHGCPYVIAACSLIAETLAGEPLSALAGVDAAELAAALEAPAHKLGSLLVIEDALRNCRQAWENNRLAGTGVRGEG